MGRINSKQKGARGERELRDLLNSYGYNTRRSQQYCGNGDDASADVVGITGLHIEAKWREKHNIYDYMEQVNRDKKPDEIGACFMKSNRKDVLVLTTLDDFMKMWKAYEAINIKGVRITLNEDNNVSKIEPL